MGTAQPIRDLAEVKEMISYYHDVRPSKRNEALIVLGLYTALRISDILELKWRDVYYFELGKFKDHLYVTEKKTGKKNIIALNRQALDVLSDYKEKCTAEPDGYLFSKTTDSSRPINRSTAYRIVKRAAEEALHNERISCHSLRKTFGYQAWQQGTPPALLMEVFNHSSYQVTKRYLGIEQDEKDTLFLEISY